MSTAYEIPLVNYNQSFQIPLGGVNYQLTVRWNSQGNCWNLDIEDEDGNDIILGIPLVIGADLLEQHAYLGIGGGLIVYSDLGDDDPPSYENLGDTGHLFFVTTP